MKKKSKVLVTLAAVAALVSIINNDKKNKAECYKEKTK